MIIKKENILNKYEGKNKFYQNNKGKNQNQSKK